MKIDNQREHVFVDSSKLLAESLKFEILCSYFHLVKTRAMFKLVARNPF